MQALKSNLFSKVVPLNIQPYKTVTSQGFGHITLLRYNIDICRKLCAFQTPAQSWKSVPEIRGTGHMFSSAGFRAAYLKGAGQHVGKQFEGDRQQQLHKGHQQEDRHRYQPENIRHRARQLLALSPAEELFSYSLSFRYQSLVNHCLNLYSHSVTISNLQSFSRTDMFSPSVIATLKHLKGHI